MTHPSHPRGFTLIEMLLVVAIIGILVTMLAPRMQMMGGPRVTAAARVLTQLTRYARTMALLNQTETVIRVSADGVIRVDAVGAPSIPAFADAALPAGADVTEAGRGAYDPGDAHPEGDEDASAAGALPDLSESISVERRLENVTVTFWGYTDTMTELRNQTGESRVAETGSEVRFRSNGTCRPHRYTLIDATGVEAVVTVDILGLARVETGEVLR